MSMVLVAFTRPGAELAGELAQALGGQAFAPAKYCGAGLTPLRGGASASGQSTGLPRPQRWYLSRPAALLCGRWARWCEIKAPIQRWW